MEYEIKSSTIFAIRISEDELFISVDVNLTYNTKEESKMQASSTGCTIVLSLENGDRNTIVKELQKGYTDWFNENYNPK